MFVFAKCQIVFSVRFYPIPFCLSRLVTLECVSPEILGEGGGKETLEDFGE